MSEELKFSCPKCGSYMYGSSERPSGVWTRHCHGNERHSCKFSFPESDDWKYFFKVTRVPFLSAEELEEYKRRQQ